MKVFSYWEQNSFSNVIPPYVLCGLSSMRKIFQDDFILLNKRNLSSWVDFDFSKKNIFFAASPDKKFDQISRIVAKSDFIRFKFIEEHGGFWLDADSVVFGDFRPDLMQGVGDGKFVWHCEAFFGAEKQNRLVKSVVANMIASERQIFANPGNVKDIVVENRSDVSHIPLTLIDPTSQHSYNAKSWAIVTQSGTQVSDFLVNDSCKMMKLYNSVTSGADLATLSVSDFLESDSLLANLFLHIEPAKNFWIDEARKIEKEVGNEN